MENLQVWLSKNAQIEIKEISNFQFAGITHVGLDGVENTFAKLINWASSKQLLGKPTSKIGRIFYDSVKIAGPTKVRMSIFLTLDEKIEDEEEVKYLKVEKAKCIVGRFEILPHEFEKAWTGLYEWKNENNYSISSDFPFEIYQNDFRQHPENKFIVDLFIPVK